MRLFPATWQGVHPVACEPPEPLSTRRLDRSLLIGFVAATASMPFRYGYRRFIKKQKLPLPGSFLANMTYGTAAIALWALTEDVAEKIMIGPFLERRGIEQRPFRIIERTKKFGIDDYIVAGASIGLGVAFTRLRPSITGWRRYIGLSIAGAFTGSVLCTALVPPFSANIEMHNRKRAQRLEYIKNEAELTENAIWFGKAMVLQQIEDPYATSPAGQDGHSGHSVIPRTHPQEKGQPIKMPNPDSIYRDYDWPINTAHSEEHVREIIGTLEWERRRLTLGKAYIWALIIEKECYVYKDSDKMDKAELTHHLYILRGIHRTLSQILENVEWHLADSELLLRHVKGEISVPVERPSLRVSVPHRGSADDFLVISMLEAFVETLDETFGERRWTESLLREVNNDTTPDQKWSESLIQDIRNDAE